MVQMLGIMDGNGNVDVDVEEMAEFFEHKPLITWDKAKEAFNMLKFLLSFIFVYI